MATPDGGLLTTAAYLRARQWRQQWLALPEPVIPAVIGPDGAIHADADGLRCLAGIVGPAALSWPAAPELPGLAAAGQVSASRPMPSAG